MGCGEEREVDIYERISVLVCIGFCAWYVLDWFLAVFLAVMLS